MHSNIAEKYFPYIMFDQAEPFEIQGVGYTVFTGPGRSSSFRREVYFDKKEVAFAVEYAVYFDFDIQHLYDLEHIWIYVDHEGNVTDAEASFHGFYLKAMALEHYEIVDGTHLKIYCQPGKHAFMQDGKLFRLLPDWHLCCNLLAGAEGVLVMDLFEGRIVTDEHRQSAAERYIKEHFAFTPTLAFEHKDMDRQLLCPWDELKAIIPGRINEIIAQITSI